MKKTLSDYIKQEMESMFSGWDCSEISQLTEAILEDVEQDVIETSDYPNYNTSDIRIAIKRTILAKF